MYMYFNSRNGYTVPVFFDFGQVTCIVEIFLSLSLSYPECSFNVYAITLVLILHCRAL